MKGYKAKLSYLPPDKDDNKADPTLPALTEELPASKWVTEEDDFLLLWTSHVAYGGETVYHCPPSKLDDEVFQILVIRYGKRRPTHGQRPKSSGVFVHNRPITAMPPVAPYS